MGDNPAPSAAFCRKRERGGKTASPGRPTSIFCRSIFQRRIYINRPRWHETLAFVSQLCRWERSVRKRTIAAVLLMLATPIALASADGFRVVKVAAVAESGLDQLKPKTIFFNDHRLDDKTDRGAFIHFDEWGRTKPVEKKFLNLFPSFAEGMVHKTIDGTRKEVKDELQMYITEARFMLSRPAASIDLKTYAKLSFVESIDPAIKQTLIEPSQVAIDKDERSTNNINPDRRWCEGASVALCVRSRYKLEGKLPIGVALANKIRDSERKISDTIEFESELRLLSASDVDEAGLKTLTGIDAPVAGLLEQNMFYVNQVIRFGKLLAVFQPNPTDANSSIVTVMIALAISSSTLDLKKKYQSVPVLRNLVPSQVLLGNSSFNTGKSISAGLPNYVRNRIKAIAEILDRG
jgi:hypothetical protein